MLKRHGFDAFLSSKCVPIERSLPDFRNDACKTEHQMSGEIPVKVSIIICFHNEVSNNSILLEISQ